MKNRELRAVLEAKGVNTLHHANTVRTSCTFLRRSALLSRKHVEDQGLSQTAQSSDWKDKRYGIWNDIFLDAVDIHYRGRERNLYGPVLFELDLASVLEDKSTQGVIRITRENPVHWTDRQTEKDRYFSSIKDLDANYSYGDFGKSLTLSIDSGALPLAPHLKRIVVDDPDLQMDEKDIFKSAVKELSTAAEKGCVRAAFASHECKIGCRCKDSYRRLGKNLGNLFSDRL